MKNYGNEGDEEEEEDVNTSIWHIIFLSKPMASITKQSLSCVIQSNHKRTCKTYNENLITAKKKGDLHHQFVTLRVWKMLQKITALFSTFIMASNSN
jgi:hypothetical protein